MLHRGCHLPAWTHRQQGALNRNGRKENGQQLAVRTNRNTAAILIQCFSEAR